MRLQDIMTTEIEKASGNEPADSAYDRMRARRVHHLVVVDAGEIRGVVSDRDLGGPRGAELRRNRTVSDLMSTHLVTAGPRTTLREAANLLRGRHVGCLVVVDDRARLAGVVTITDLLELIGRGFEKPRATSERPTLRHHQGPRRRPESRVKR
jgi:acetoin utilization protein AcuB